jgi:hypothetical protein
VKASFVNGSGNNLIHTTDRLESGNNAHDCVAAGASVPFARGKHSWDNHSANPNWRSL